MSTPSGSPARPRSASSSLISFPSASGMPVSIGIAPRIGVTHARHDDSGSQSQNI